MHKSLLDRIDKWFCDRLFDWSSANRPDPPTDDGPVSLLLFGLLTVIIAVTIGECLAR